MRNSLLVGAIILILLLIGAAYVLYINPDILTNRTPTTEEENGTGSESDNVLDLPGPDASQDELADHFQRAESAAVETGTLNISGCTPEPLVLKVPAGSSVTVENEDSAPHTLTMGERVYTINANSQQDVAFDFSQGPGLYAYMCDASTDASGLLIAS